MTVDMRALTAEARSLTDREAKISVADATSMIHRLANAVDELETLREMMNARANQSLTMSEFLGRLAPPNTHEAEVKAAWADHFAVAGSKRSF